jgi:hypothetical protein
MITKNPLGAITTTMQPMVLSTVNFTTEIYKINIHVMKGQINNIIYKREIFYFSKS